MRRFLGLVILASSLSIGLVINPARAQVNAGDSLALVALYNSTDGPNWTDNSNWLVGTVDTWFGVTVSATRVVIIDLFSNNLVGVLPAELGDLTNLNSLTLNGNQLSGGIPIEFGNLISISFLSLQANQLTGAIPLELGNLSNLSYLILSFNQLSGPLPLQLTSYPGLIQFNVQFNLLTGSIPPELANLSTLQELHLDRNFFTGTIPTELGTLTSLTRLTLGDNQLTGIVPVELGNLVNLTWLTLSNNQLTGNIPNELSNLSNLDWLYLNDNQLSGTIPPEIGTLLNLQRFWFNNNSFNGPIPSSFQNLIGLEELRFELNKFVDLPDLSTLTSLTTFITSNNDFTFDDLEPNMILFTDSTNYSPQNLIGIADTFLLNQGDTLTLSIPVGGSANQYQWQKDGINISGATNDFLDLADVDSTDNGTYTLLITSSLVPGLILSSANNVVNVMAPPDFYWVGDGGVWTDLTHWSSTSGGSPDQITLPGKLNNVFFDSNSFSAPNQVVTIVDDSTEVGARTNNMDWTGVTNNPTFQIIASFSQWIGSRVYGSLIFDPNMILDFSGAEFYFYSNQDYVIDTKGLYLGDNCWLYINAPVPVVDIANDVVCNILSDINPAGVFLNKGTFRLNGHSLNEKDSYVWIAGDSSTFDITGSPLDISTLYLNPTTIGATLIDDNATIMVSTLLRTNGVDFNHIILTDSARVGLYSNSFDTLEIAPGANIQFESEVTQNVGELLLQGTSLLPITISATKLDTAAIISKPTGRVDASHVSLKDNTAVGGALFNAYSSIDLGNTTGWNFRSNSAQDSLALLSLFNATGGSSWVNSTNWNTAEPFSAWYGVTVNDSSRVSGLNLPFNNLNGVIPPEISDLTDLTYLWLGSNNGLAGSIPPEIGQLQNLDTLAFSYTSLTGTIPDELFNLTNLIRFSMSNSLVTGTLSPGISNLTNLRHIALWNTPLSGEIPNEFWDMTQLERIYLGTNQQGGEISPKIGDFTNLDEFWISGSNLTGIIPPEIGNAETTTLLNLFNNNLYGPVPDEINNLTELKRFEIQNNNLDFLPVIMGLDSLQIFKISNNKFTYDDILPNQSLITENTSQKPFGDSVQVQAYTFEGLRLDPGLEIIDGQEYQWYKDNVALPEGTGHYYFIDDFREGDGGVFYLEVSHPDVDSLTLTRNPMVVSENTGDPPKPGAVEVISPNGDGINDEMNIKNIELYPQHRILIYDVLGRLVYFTTEYDNINNPFIGIGNQDGFKELPSGTYYYLIDVGDTKKNGTGFFVMKKR